MGGSKVHEYRCCTTTAWWRSITIICGWQLTSARGPLAATPRLPTICRRSTAFYADWSPERILRWAGEIGPEVAALVGKVLDEGEHPEQGFKVALGIINLHRKYGEERLQRACGRALEFPLPLI